MKKSNKYRNGNSNNSQYSLNYKFDSVSVAGKISGTALDLIKKYNELAKEAHSNGNYTEMENFRQYAEHYRKIVTDINEKKNSATHSNQTNTEDVAEKVEATEMPAAEKAETQEPQNETVEKKEFTVVEVSEPKKAETKKTAKKKAVRKKAADVNEQKSDE